MVGGRVGDARLGHGQVARVVVGFVLGVQGAVLGGALLVSAARRRRSADAVIERLERAGALPKDVLERLRKRGE